MALTQVYTAQSGDTITSARWNNEFGNIYNNGTDVGFPLTKAVSFAGYTITWDAAGVTTMISSGTAGFAFTPGNKTGTPSTTGGVFNCAASTFTDSNTAGSGTATAWAGWAIQRPTLAATNASVTTTNVASFYIANDVAAGTNETLTNTWAIWVDAGECRFDAGLGGIGAPNCMELRLTLTTATPVTTADVTAAGTIYLTPYKGSHISLYSGSQWHTYSTAEVSLALTATSGKPYDVWAYNNAGTVTLETLVWTNDTTRATALAYQDGVLVKSGDATRRYLGSFYATGANQTTDSAANRHLWNYYHRVNKHLAHTAEGTDSWTYSTATWRQANAGATNQFDVMIGVSEDLVKIVVHGQARNSSNTDSSCAVGVGVDATNSNSANVYGATVNTTGSPSDPHAEYYAFPGVGQHTFAWVEISTAGATTTWFGDHGTTATQSGMVGELLC